MSANDKTVAEDLHIGAEAIARDIFGERLTPLPTG